MQTSYLRRITTLFFLLLFPALAGAETQQILVEGDLQAAFGNFSSLETRSLQSRPRSFRSVDPIRIAAQMPNGMDATLVIQSLVQRYWPAYFTSDHGTTSDRAEVTLFRGVAQLGESQVPLAAAIYTHSGSPVLFAEFTAPDRSEYFHLQIPLSGADTSIAATLETTRGDELSDLRCDSDAEHDMFEHLPAIHRSQTGQRSDRTGSALRVLELATEADFEFFTRYGSESNARIAAIVNAADTIYERDLSIDLQIKFQHTVTTSSQPFTSTTSGSLLDQFVDYSNSNSQLGEADAYHLFSGKDFDGSVIGTAYISVVCSAPSLSYAVNQDIGTLTYLVFAHELGHNLGAQHDQGSAPSIMGPSLSSAVSGFSSFSIDQVSAYVSGHGSCLPADGSSGGGENPPPPPPPVNRSASLTLAASFDRSKNSFSASVSALGATASDCRSYLSMSTDITMADATTVAWGRTGSKTVRGSGKNKKRTSLEASSLFVQAFYSCPSLGVNLASDTQSISVGNATKSKQVVAPAKWMKTTLKAAAKSARKRGNNS